LDVAGRSLEVAIFLFRALEIASGTSLASEQMLTHAEHASHWKCRSSVDSLTIHERAVGRPEIFDDNIAVHDADEAVEARDIVVREDDVEIRVSSCDHGTFRERDPSSLLAALGHYERKHLLNRLSRLVARKRRKRRSESRRCARALWVVGLLLGHVASSIAENLAAERHAAHQLMIDQPSSQISRISHSARTQFLHFFAKSNSHISRASGRLDLISGRI